MKLSDPQAKNSLVSRLKRIEGQVRGVQAMVSDERDCNEILQQLTAIQSAVRSTSLTFIEEYASRSP
jgi:DNA-binding FrmR family transcriptional regulator